MRDKEPPTTINRIPLTSRRLRVVAVGAFLGLGAPVGWLIIKLIQGVAPSSAVVSDPLLFVYLLGATAVVFCGFGFILSRREDELAVLNQELLSLATTDDLTQLPNRRSFERRFSEALAISRRLGAPLSLAFFDLDNFKEINDTYGHASGDDVLVDVSKAMASVLREGETLARVGGDEFALLLLGDDGLRGAQACERVRAAVAGVTVDVGVAEVRVTMTAGVASTADLVDADENTLTSLADALLYRGKNSGRNQVVASGGVRVCRRTVDQPSFARYSLQSSLAVCQG